MEGDRLVSTPLRGNEFASVCSFKPGRYRYQVRQVDVALGAGTRDYDGTLIVE